MYTKSFIGVLLHYFAVSLYIIYSQAFSLTLHFRAAGDELHSSPAVWRKMLLRKKYYTQGDRNAPLFSQAFPPHLFPRGLSPSISWYWTWSSPETRFQPVRVFMCLPGGRSRHVLPDCGIRRPRLRWAGRRQVVEALSSARRDGGCCCLFQLLFEQIQVIFHIKIKYNAQK